MVVVTWGGFYIRHSWNKLLGSGFPVCPLKWLPKVTHPLSKANIWNRSWKQRSCPFHYTILLEDASLPPLEKTNEQKNPVPPPPSSCWILLSSHILSQLRQSFQYVDPWITEKVPIWNILSHSQPCVSMYFSKIWLLLIRKQEVLAVRIGNGGLNCQKLLFQCSHVTVPNICQVTMHPSSFDCNRQCFIFISQTVGCHENYETSPIPPEDCIKPSCPNSELSLGNTYLVTSHKIVSDR